MYSNLSELSKLEMIRGLHQLRRSLLLSPRRSSKSSKSSKSRGRKKGSKAPTFSDPEKQKLFDSLPEECKALFM